MTKFVAVDIASEELESSLRRWDQVSNATVKSVRTVCDEKNRSPHISFPLIELGDAVAVETDLHEKVDHYNAVLSECVQQIQDFKQSSNLETIDTRLVELSRRIDEAARILKRFDLHEQCARYNVMTAEMERLDHEIPLLETELRDDQSDYLGRFFDSLNRWFTLFGSRDFSLERVEIRRGHTPIYFLRVNYRGVAIDEHALDRVFSESDRRALALAVFWAQLQELPAAEKAKQIVILDDPITSFDDGRITAVHREIIRLLEEVQQVVVLSHYSYEIRSFFKTHGDTGGLRLLCLETTARGSRIAVEDSEAFIRSEHEKARIELTAFADGSSNTCEFGKLRVFLEQELNYRFADQIAYYSLGKAQLSAKIDGLADNNVISDGIARECHVWRRTLNPPHHDWPSADLEDRRRTTRELLDLIYTRLVPISRQVLGHNT